MTDKKRGLGKGLSAILGDIPSAEDIRKPIGYINKDIVGTRTRGDVAGIMRIPVEMIQPNPYQPRMNFDQEALEELAESIKTLGLVQPITVRKISDSQYQIISGERRYRASRLAGLTTVPAYIREADDQGMLEMAIVENIQRENLDPIEVALSYQRLIDECKLTQEEMSSRLGKKRTSVANQLRLLKLPAKVQHDLKVGLLTVGHAKVILSIDDPAIQEKLCDLVVSGHLNVRQLETKVRELLKGSEPQNKPGRKPVAELPEAHQKLAQQFGKYFENGVTIRRSQDGKGTITVKFTSDDQINALLEALNK